MVLKINFTYLKLYSFIYLNFSFLLSFFFLPLLLPKAEYVDSHSMYPTIKSLLEVVLIQEIFEKIHITLEI